MKQYKYFKIMKDKSWT